VAESGRCRTLWRVLRRGVFGRNRRRRESGRILIYEHLLDISGFEYKRPKRRRVCGTASLLQALQDRADTANTKLQPHLETVYCARTCVDTVQYCAWMQYCARPCGAF
jgi:hypothetical protein